MHDIFSQLAMLLGMVEGKEREGKRKGAYRIIFSVDSQKRDLDGYNCVHGLRVPVVCAFGGVAPGWCLYDAMPNALVQLLHQIPSLYSI